MKKSITLTICLLSLFFVSSCAMYRASKADEAKEELKGYTKEKILSCMGVPLQKSSEGDIEVWKYHSGGGTDSASYSYGRSKFNESLLNNMVDGTLNNYRYINTRTRIRACTVNIVFKDSHVTTVNYSGRSGGMLTKNEQCEYAVANCI